MLTALENKQYDKAITIFTELGYYSDSASKLAEAQNKKKEARYQEGLTALKNKQYKKAVQAKKMLDAGVITQQEFSEIKARLIAKI